LKVQSLFCLLMFIAVVGCSIDGELNARMREDAKAVAEQERHAKDDVFITSDGIAMAIGRFLLIRRSQGVCAVRFTRMYRGGDSHPPSVFSSGEESLYADYQWFYMPLGGINFSSRDTKSGHETASMKAPIGIGRFAFGWGNPMVECGPFRLSWNYPTNVAYKFMTDPPEEYKLAPTKWRKIGEVQLSDPHLVWYGYEGKRAATYIPIENIW
jgi:hypothetical protein